MDTKKFKILIVDDEADILEFVGYNLKKKVSLFTQHGTA
jgi:DNA-binding response OmpR family regulator